MTNMYLIYNVNNFIYIGNRTNKPCGGMPKGDIKTTIPQNSQKLKIEWHLGYGHRGTPNMINILWSFHVLSYFQEE